MTPFRWALPSPLIRRSRPWGAALVIAAVTFVVCFLGHLFGRQAGKRLGGKADVIGGLVLVGIGIEIWLTGIL